MSKRAYTLKVDEIDLDAWKACAKETGLAVSEWIRRRCNGDARELLRPGSIVDTDTPREPKQGDFEAAVTKRVRKAKDLDCVHGKPFGGFCTGCGGVAHG